MKLEDIESRARSESIHWFNRQCRDTSERYYLYYLPSSHGHDGGFLIARVRPSRKHELAAQEPLRVSWTVERAQSWIKDTVWRLPILESEDAA